MQLPAGVRADYSSEYEQAIRIASENQVSQYTEAAARAGVDPDHVREAMQLQNRDREVVVGEIDEIPFVSSRICVGMPGSGRTYRGGAEWMALPDKAAVKSTVMCAKEDNMGTGDEGGKGALWVPPQYRGDITDEWRWKAWMTHALMHGINGYTNATATDIGTNKRDMNAMVEALIPTVDRIEEAYAAVSGADEEHGGIPDFQMETTGWGSAIFLEEYLNARKEFGGSDDEIAYKLRNDIRLRLLLQALGKAGGPYARLLPTSTELAGAMEYAGAIYDPNNALDPKEIIRLAQANGLAEGSATGGQKWLPADREEFWRLKADIIVTAYDKDQIDEGDIRDTEAQVIGEISNNGVTVAGRKAAHELEHDIMSGVGKNGAGTLASSKRGRMLLYGTYRSVAELEASWERDMRSNSRRTARGMYQERARTGQYVSPEDIMLANIAKVAAARRNAVRTGLVSKAR